MLPDSHFNRVFIRMKNGANFLLLKLITNGQNFQLLPNGTRLGIMEAVQ
ncbi:MAG: hypothetical protein AAB336_01145 [Acidobacteriota bacterium]